MKSRTRLTFTKPQIEALTQAFLYMSALGYESDERFSLNLDERRFARNLDRAYKKLSEYSNLNW